MSFKEQSSRRWRRIWKRLSEELTPIYTKLTPIDAFFPVRDGDCAMQRNGDSIRTSVFCLLKKGNSGLNRV